MPGGCYDRSLLMFFCFPEALLARGNNKDLELTYGKEHGGNGWIEIGDYVYDPSLLMRFDKKLFYRIYQPTNVAKYTKQEYCSTSGDKELYDDITKTTIQDLQNPGLKKLNLKVTIPSIKTIAEASGNEEFIKELNEHLASVNYDEP